MGLLDSVSDALSQPEFRDGLRPGLIAAALSALVGIVWRVWRGRPAPIAGLALAGAAVWGLDQRAVVPDRLVVGLALAGGVGLLIATSRVPLIVQMAAALPAAWWIADAAAAALPAGEIDTMRRAVVVALVAVAGPLVARGDQHWGRMSWTPALVAITTGGIYATVPDTEQALVLMGAAAPVTALGWPIRLARLGAPGAMAVVGAAAYVVAVGGIGRDGSVIGGAACLGLLVVDPLIRLVGGRAPTAALSNFGGTVTLGATHLGLVLWASRVAGLQESGSDALLRVTVGAVVVGTLWGMAGRSLVRPVESGVEKV